MTSSPAETNPEATGNDDDNDTEAHRPDSPPSEGNATPDDALPPPE